MEFVASLSQGRTAAAQCGLFTYKSVPVIFEPPCIYEFDLSHTRIPYSFRPYVTLLSLSFYVLVRKTVLYRLGVKTFTIFSGLS